MANERILVRGSTIPYPLRCIDVIDGGTKCKDLQDAHPKGETDMFKCFHRRRGFEGNCSGHSFLYPRKWAGSFTAPGGVPAFHFHQGIDIYLPSGTEDAEILSATNGTVVQIQRWNEKSNGYGNVVAIHTPGPRGEDGITYWYAHCKKIFVKENEEVFEQQPIALVGNSGNAGKPHLHFETLRGKVTRRIGGYEDERKIGQEDSPLRLDPLEVLALLGPWGMRQVFDPIGKAFTQALARGHHEKVESSSHGGYFPLGANNHWHGGVHLPMPAGSDVFAPFDATIVAARLDPDPAHAMQPDGHTNFILLRHEISPTYYNLFQGKSPAAVDPKPSKKAKVRAVGTRRHCTNDLADVVQVKRKLNEHNYPPLPGDDEGTPPRPYYEPKNAADLDDPTVTAELGNAIAAFQKANVPGIKPDGVVNIPGATWTALHDGAPPDEPSKPTKPGAPPSVPPERVLYSLLMHLQPLAIDRKLAEAFPWLARVKLSAEPVAPPPEEPDEEERKRAQQEHEEDLAEAAHELAGAVGAPSGEGVPAQNFFDDVLWVHKRLIRFEFHEGPPSSTCDEGLIAAIREFQNTHHKFFKKNHKGDGRVDPGGETIKALRKTRAELMAGTGGGGSKPRIEVDPAFVERARERHPNGMAKVMSGLDVKVRSGDALWRSGQAQGYVSDDRAVVKLDQIHWEVFSEHLLVTDWDDPIEDLDEDLAADVPKQLLAFIEAPSPEFERNGLLRPSEICEFYRSRRGEFLRRTPCHFFNHWALDPDTAVVRLQEMGFEEIGLADRLRPLMWWNEARDVLPSTPLVWHYNPIELLAQYAEHLAAMKPPEKGNPATHPTLVVRVHYDDGTPLPNVEVQLLYGIAVKRTAITRSDGEALFLAVPVGGYGVRVHDPATAPEAITVGPLEDENDSQVVDIYTDVPAPPRLRGTLHVTVRRHTGTIAGDGIEVWLEHAASGPVMNGFTDNGKLSFEGIVYGEYLVVAGDAKPVAVTLDKKKKTVPTILLPAPIVPLHITVLIDGVPAAGQTVKLDKKGVAVGSPQLTDLDGVAVFEVPEGRYRAQVGAHSRGVIARLHDPKQFTMKLSSKDAPKPVEFGTLAVKVKRREDGKPALDEPVLVSDVAHGVFEADYPDALGAVSFELTRGSYAVRVAEEQRQVDVGTWATTTVEFEVDE